MKADNQGELMSKSQKATGKPYKVDEWSDAAPSNNFNQSMIGMPLKGRTMEQIEDCDDVYDIFPGVGKHNSRS